LERIKIPRHVHAEQTDGKKLELHVFSDSSEKAMAAVAYLRIVMENGSVGRTYLLMAKTQVAPLSCNNSQARTSILCNGSEALAVY